MISNILFVSTLNRNSRELGGQEIFIKKLIRILKSEGYGFYVASPASLYSNGDDALESGCEFFINPKKLFFFNTLFQLKKIVKKKNISLIHSNDCYSNFLAFWLKLISGGALKTAAIIHDDYYSNDSPLFLKFKKKFYYLTDKLILSFFDSNLFYSDYLLKKLSFKKSIFLSPGIDFFSEDAPLNLPAKTAEKLKIGWVGRPDFFKKGFDVFSNAAKKLIPENSFEFHIAGFCNPVLIKNYLDIRDKNIFFHGYIKNINVFFKKIDVLVIPSRYEGLCLVFLEAAAHKIPLIYSDIPVFVHIAKTLGYPLPPAKTGDADDFIKGIKNIRFNDTKELNEIPERIRGLYSFEILKNKYLNFINSIVK
ncbi:MAG TPA: glycosyltransferase family 4 protein [bacterium]|nr:glycosyltransferase family 4 protein [bacterium]HPN30636.1 glycosyltransferase family 4 protein [bacterium]